MPKGRRQIEAASFEVAICDVKRTLNPNYLLPLLSEPNGLQRRRFRWTQKFTQIGEYNFKTVIMLVGLPFQLFQLKQDIFVVKDDFFHASINSHNLNIDLYSPLAVENT